MGLMGWLWLVPLSAQAQAEDDPIARSVAVATEGLERFNRDDFQGAYDKFYLAEQLAHSPVFQLYLARCKARLGELLAARAQYDQVIAEPLPDGAPSTWSQAQQDAKEERDALAIPKLRVTVRPTEAAVTIDGTPRGATDGPLVDVDPGEHRVEAILGDRRAHQVVVVAAGDPPTAVELVLPEAPAATTPVPTEGTPGPLWPGIVLTSVGAVGLGVGAVFGGLALSLDADLEEPCGPERQCPNERADDLDRLRAYETGSTVSIVAGGLLATTGIVLLAWRPGGDEARVTTAVGLDGIYLKGRF